MTTPTAQALPDRILELLHKHDGWQGALEYIAHLETLTQAGGDAVAEKVDIETRNGRRFYFNHNPPNTMLAIIFNDILRANGTFEDNIEAHYRREHAARPAPAQENDNGTV